ncbi:MAG: cytochrome c oxidase subunit II [Elusimicrobia bacterium]|nr:cytochrome c oxidase subunit II [Elusimicrobiota bacterium]
MVKALENYGWFLPVQASDFAADIDRGLIIIHWAMALIFVLWGIFFVYLLVRYRHRDGHKVERSHMSLAVSMTPDVAVLGFEILLIAVYAVPSWSRMKITVPPAEGAVQVELMAEQFNWSARYPGKDGKFGRTAPDQVDFTNPFGIVAEDPAGADDVVAVNEMRFPVDETVLVKLTSKDVIHSFFIPEFRVKQDAVPGMALPVWFKPNRVGEYELTCAQLCGVGHAIMRADVKVEDRASFDAWLASKKAAEHADAATPAAVEQW